MKRVDATRLAIRPFDLLDREWALLVAGSERGNPMTVSWGGMGTLWNRPAVTVYVRPTRHTFTLLESEPEFTLNFLPPHLHHALDYCGSCSGRDGEKWKGAGVTPLPCEAVKVPRVAEAELSLECAVIASMQVDPARFLDPTIDQLYPGKDYHKVYIGEVLAAWAEERFLAS